MITPQSLDREKYLRIIENEGLSSALTALHQDMWAIEFDCFEGAEGYRPQVFQDLKAYRQFSLELWDKKFDAQLKP